MKSVSISLEEPYFMTNPEWYEYNFEEGRVVLTDKATPKARESYEEFNKDYQDFFRVPE